MNFKGRTDVGTSFIKSKFSSFVKEDLTVGKTYQFAVTGTNSYQLWHYGLVSSALTFLFSESSSSSYPTD